MIKILAISALIALSGCQHGYYYPSTYQSPYNSVGQAYMDAYNASKQRNAERQTRQDLQQIKRSLGIWY